MVLATFEVMGWVCVSVCTLDLVAETYLLRTRLTGALDIRFTADLWLDPL